MDFGLDLAGIEGLISGQNTGNVVEQQIVLEGKPRSGSIKQERSDPYDDVGNRVSKVAKRVDDLGAGLRSNEQMLSFSSSTKDLGLISDKNAQNLAFNYNHRSSYPKTPTGIRGPFTPAQWIELEHQAMIFKYFIANIPVPPNLLLPIRKALSSSGFPGFSVGSYPSHSYGWGSFHLGFSSSTDPEPGRCRRTDGKKWRCSRDAVPDQKYCERHINRGRHRSRKPVEGLTGQAASGPTTTTKGAPAIPAAMSSLVTSSSGGASNTVTIAQHQIKGFQSSGSTNASTDPINSRFHDQQGLTVIPSTMNLKSKDDPPFSILKQNIPLDESSQSEFGLVSTDSLLNPSQKGSYFSCKTYNSLLEFNAQPTQGQDQYHLRPFTADWPKDHQSNRSTLPWAEELKSDWTHLSMSIPMSSNFSSPSSPAHERMAPSPLRLTRELDPSSQIGSGTGPIMGEMGAKQNSRIPTAWVNSMGGPLGEVLLKNASNAVGPYKPENQRGEGGWEDGSPQVGSSPTGVLQKSTFVSLSNSSSGGSSPRGENKMIQAGASLCDEPPNGSVTHASSNSIPSCKC